MNMLKFRALVNQAMKVGLESGALDPMQAVAVLAVAQSDCIDYMKKCEEVGKTLVIPAGGMPPLPPVGGGRR